MAQPKVDQVQKRKEEVVAVQNPKGSSFCRYIMIIIAAYFAVSIITPFLFGPSSQQIQQMKANNHEGIVNALSKGDKVNVSVEILYLNQVLYYNTSIMEYTDEYSPITLEFSLELKQLPLTQNITVKTKATVAESSVLQKGLVIQREQGNFSAYKTLRKQSGIASEEMSIKSKGSTYETKIPHIFNIMMLYSDDYFFNYDSFKMNTRNFKGYTLFREKQRTYYRLPLDISQLHVTNKHYQLPQPSQNITINIYTYSLYKYMMISGIAKPSEAQLAVPMMAELYSDDSMNQMKEIFFENNIILVVTSFTLSVLQCIFQFLAVKNDVKIWKNISKHKGLSFKVLYMNLFFSIISLMYFLDNATNKLLIYFEIVSIAVTVWKIFKTTEISRKKEFPYFTIAYPEWYEKEVKVHDNAASKYLYYLLCPLFFGYTFYKYQNDTYTSLYSFLLESVLGFIYIFQFILMTPQLFLNYRLKSVAHLPWRSLIYQFLNTIIDDLFAFMITMPWLRRLSCFRDDIIFLIYVYQRIIYRTDYERRNTLNDN